MTEQNKGVTPPVFSKDPKEDAYLKTRLQTAITSVINQQMASDDPPEATVTFERLQEEGFSKDEAFGLMSQLVSMEAAELFAGTGNIDMARYIAALETLPAPFAKPKKPQEEDE
ncbi:MAG: hypothetical protein QNL04_04370 [SAR324 cluster bacterium]|nr:hypothetical protein [SAR324 cluster bacterium]